MTTPTDPDLVYHELLDEIIQRIQNDDTANSATVEELVQRLREMQALGLGEILERSISTDDGLTGGGDLTEDRTIGLAEWVREALSKASSALQASSLEEYLTEEEIGEKFATIQAARQVAYLPFTHPGTVVGTVTSPRIGVPVAGQITHLTVVADEPGAALTVRLTGGASGQVVLPAGDSTVTAEVASAVTAPVGVALQSTGVGGVVVTMRVQEGSA